MQDSKLAEYFEEILGRLGTAKTKKMFNCYCMYLNDKPVGFLINDRLLVKTNLKMRILRPELTTQKLFPEAVNPMWIVEDPDNTEYLLELFKFAYDNLPAPKPKAPRRSTREKDASVEEKEPCAGFVSGSPWSDPDIMGKDVLTPTMRTKGILNWLAKKPAKKT